MEYWVFEAMKKEHSHLREVRFGGHVVRGSLTLEAGKTRL
jgi:hypothetical protein